MEDYPRTIVELERRFATEPACRDYLFALRWPDGFVCPRCAGDRAWQMSRGLWLCTDCRRQVSIRAGTIFQGSRLPLTLWFRAMWHVVSQKNGVSALGIQRVLGLGSYETAWTWLHKLRRAMVRPGRDRLSGRVEVDEAFLGASEEGVMGRETRFKVKIAVAAQKDGPRIGRVRLRRVKDFSGASLTGFVEEAVEPGSTVHTDGWQAYNGLRTLGYVHDVTVLHGAGKAATELLPRVHRVVSHLKRWLMGTLHGAVRPRHIDYYLDEFTFRFNRRTSRSRGKLFYRLAQQAVQIGPHPYRSIIKHTQDMGEG
jgi:transposase-like protein